MSVIESVNKLLEFFVNNTHFELKKDFNKVCLVSETDADKASLLIALDELAKQNFITKKEFEGVEYWILVKPIIMHNQEISINTALCLEISNILNSIIEEDEQKCNPLNVTEKDIFNLVSLIKNSEESSENNGAE